MIGVLFCTSEYLLYEDLGISIPCKFEEVQGRKLIFYTIVYNWTLNFRSPFLSDQTAHWPKDAFALRLKTSIDNGLVDLFSKYDIEIGSNV